MDRKDELIKKLVNNICEDCGDCEQDIYYALKENGFTIEEMKQYWEDCPIVENPYRANCFCYTANGTPIGEALFLGAYKNWDSLNSTLDKIKDTLMKIYDKTAYMLLGVKLIAKDDVGDDMILDTFESLVLPSKFN